MHSTFVFFLLFAAVCAYVPNNRRIHRIAGGENAKIKQFPYFARLLISKTRDGVTASCGGALISKRTILTAAHCLEGALSVIILVGITKSWPSEPTYQIRGAFASTPGAIRQHENYNKTSFENDIALINFAPDVTFNDAVKAVNLPEQEDLEGQTAVVAGFGKTGTKAQGSDDLLFTNRKFLPASSCEGSYPAYFRAENHLCVDGSDNIATCLGDSGGPLAVDGPDGSKTVVGVVSFGAVECDTGYPDIYTKVSSYVDWVRKHMK